MLGWRARIGFITPPNLSPTVLEFRRIAPAGVEFVQTMLSLDGPWGGPDWLTEERIERMLGQLEGAVKMMADIGVDVIVQSGTPFIFVKGASFEEELMSRLSSITSTPIVLMAPSVVAALRELGASRLNVVTYYSDRFNELYRRYLEEKGFQVKAVERLPDAERREGAEPYLYHPNNIPPERIYRYSRQLFKRSPTADALVISGGAFRTLDIIAPLEKDLGVSVVTSNQATFYRALLAAGIRERIEGYGRLIERLGIQRGS